MSQPTLEDVIEKLNDLTKKLESAIVKDEYGQPDYVAHRLYHKKENENTEEYKKTKSKILRDVITWAIVGVISVIAGLLSKVYIIK